MHSVKTRIITSSNNSMVKWSPVHMTFKRRSYILYQLTIPQQVPTVGSTGRQELWIMCKLRFNREASVGTAPGKPVHSYSSYSYWVVYWAAYWVVYWTAHWAAYTRSYTRSCTGPRIGPCAGPRTGSCAGPRTGPRTGSCTGPHIGLSGRGSPGQDSHLDRFTWLVYT